MAVEIAAVAALSDDAATGELPASNRRDMISTAAEAAAAVNDRLAVWTGVDKNRRKEETTPFLLLTLWMMIGVVVTVGVPERLPQV